MTNIRLGKSSSKTGVEKASANQSNSVQDNSKGSNNKGSRKNSKKKTKSSNANESAVPVTRSQSLPTGNPWNQKEAFCFKKPPPNNNIKTTSILNTFSNKKSVGVNVSTQTTLPLKLELDRMFGKFKDYTMTENISTISGKRCPTKNRNNSFPLSPLSSISEDSPYNRKSSFSENKEDRQLVYCLKDFEFYEEKEIRILLDTFNKTDGY